jgi:cell fate regulator YaaT (PSP1 superfamily)
MQEVTGVRFQRAGKVYDFLNTSTPHLNAGDFVVVETSRGFQMGWVVTMRELSEQDNLSVLKPLLRKASTPDLLLREYYRKKEKGLLAQVRMAVVERKIRIKLAKAEYAFNGASITFYYGSNKEVNLSELEQELSQRLETQVKFRQVGPRDVAKMMGGAGACGLPVRCCSAFLTNFKPISIRMAKTQDIPLVPSEIAGMCGRLRCCLAYEYEFYKSARKGMPKLGHWVVGENISGKVVDRNIPKQSVIVQTEHGVRVETLVKNLWANKEGKAPAQGGSCGTDGGCSSCGSH